MAVLRSRSAQESRGHVRNLSASSFFDKAWYFPSGGVVSYTKPVASEEPAAIDGAGSVKTEDQATKAQATQRLASLKSDPEEMRRVFQKFDENTDDVICSKDLRGFMRRLGYEMTEEEAAAMLASVDHNGDGKVDFDEFFSLYTPVDDPSADAGDETLVEAFRVFDQNQDGLISAQELQRVLINLEFPQGRSLKACQKMIDSVDTDGNGEIDLKEFEEMMSSKFILKS